MTTTRWLDDAEAHAWRGYLRMNALLMAQLQRDLQRDSDLSMPDYDVLVILSEAAPQRLRMRELGAQLLWEKSRVSHHITRMERRGLVRREDCDADARGAFVTITSDGMRAIEEAAPAHVENVRRHFIDQLSPQQLRVLGEITDVIVGQMSRSPRMMAAATSRSLR